MNKIELTTMASLHEREARRLRSIELSCVNCNNCEHFKNRGGLCGMYDAAPPPEVLSVGCDQWLYNEVPF